MKKRFVRVICAALMMLIAVSPVQARAEFWDFLGFSGEPEATAEPTRRHEGTVRVLLSSLGTPETVNLRLEGIYSVENDAGFRFFEGAELTLTAEEDNIYMVTDALTLALGNEVTFTRHAAEDGSAGGIVIAQAGGNLYKGDLTVWASAGELTMRLTTPMEEYLLGVVAYEMSDSFPIEALKAQAVAARTYALSRMWNASEKRYDVVDTTMDQVYKGVDGRYENIARAVQETAGVVGFYQDQPAVCYFSASNGGQTALATDVLKKNGDYGYLEIAEDPYDLENPRSMVNSVDVFADYPANDEALRQLLDARLSDALAAADCSMENAQIVRIDAVEAAEPRFAGTRQYEKLVFTVAVQERQDEPTPSEAYPEWMQGLLPGMDTEQNDVPAAEQNVEEIPIVLDVYADVKDGLHMGLNSSDYEMLSVEEADGGWRLCMRRFGHGVGMSQRGAQWMASKYGMGYRDILAFYYPGLQFETVLWTGNPTELDDAVVTMLRSRGIPLNGSGLKELQEGERYAQVNLAGVSSTLNLRAEPGTHSEILTVLLNGSRLIVTEMLDDGWCKVRTAVVEGYVKAEYLTIEE